MPGIDLVDETFVVAPLPDVAAAVGDASRWRAWWPDLELTVFMDRDLEGVRWSVTGALVGSAEIWLEPFADGAVVHFYLRAHPSVPGAPSTARELPDSPRGYRTAARMRARRALAWKQTVWTLKAELEGDRRPGTAVYR